MILVDLKKGLKQFELNYDLSFKLIFKLNCVLTVFEIIKI